ncbi:ATP-binding cassette domain-containing protein [Streptomyces lichenis]|uniref:ATP-binding cassette domain-containing protein n=1 Tax=Streptomyces lichenis TaxID=2306967 RepID=A0ABT0IGG7_9ACTN|nr:ATP-binding cassette domain-containing protein [Streptomyces lichenis]MCK8680425.1 ATP-binding cassette domain-containing protein [Streptomyces lichenis]
MKGPRGWAFQDVDVAAPAGALVAIEGPSGSGRTCLLLALTGRMRATAGHAEVGGVPLPKKMGKVRRISALGPVCGVSDLDPAFTVAEHLRERALLQRHFTGSPLDLLRPRATRAAARARVTAALEAAGLDPAALPKGERTSVRDLERLEGLRLSLALALMAQPRLLAVDDTDLKLSGTDREAAWELLRSIAASGITVLAVCSEAPADALVVRTVTDRPDTGRTDASPTPEEAAQPEKAEAPKAAAVPEGAEDTEAEPRPQPQEPHQTQKSQQTQKTQTQDEEGAADAFAETGRA